MSVEAEFLSYSSKKLAQCCERIESCVAMLTPEQLWSRGSDNENAAGNLVLHLTGNIRQWILSGVGGAPDHRVRDAEFAARSGGDAAELLRGLRGVVDEAIGLFGTLPPSRLMDRMTIQGHDVTVLEAIYHVVEHFSGHTGQIIYLTKAFTQRDLGFYGYLAKPGAGAGKTP